MTEAKNAIPDELIVAREVHAAWRDGMLSQGRPVEPDRMQWETLSKADQALDLYIGLQIFTLLDRSFSAQHQERRRAELEQLVEKWQRRGDRIRGEQAGQVEGSQEWRASGDFERGLSAAIIDLNSALASAQAAEPLDLQVQPIMPGEWCRHRGGGTFCVVARRLAYAPLQVNELVTAEQEGEARIRAHVNTGEQIVIYRFEVTGNLWVLPARLFDEPGQFSRIAPAHAAEEALPCPWCGGSGGDCDDSSKYCDECEGTGRVSRPAAPHVQAEAVEGV